MAHVIIIEDARTALQSKSASPPSQAQSNLMAAIDAADAYAHGSSPDEGVIEAIEDVCYAIVGYLNVVPTPSDIRLQGYADDLNEAIP